MDTPAVLSQEASRREGRYAICSPTQKTESFTSDGITRIGQAVSLPRRVYRLDHSGPHPEHVSKPGDIGQDTSICHHYRVGVRSGCSNALE